MVRLNLLDAALHNKHKATVVHAAALGVEQVHTGVGVLSRRF